MNAKDNSDKLFPQFIVMMMMMVMRVCVCACVCELCACACVYLCNLAFYRRESIVYNYLLPGTEL